MFKYRPGLFEYSTFRKYKSLNTCRHFLQNAAYIAAFGALPG